MNKEKKEWLKLDNQLCFPLYACSKEVIRKYKPFLEEIDLTYTQYITMLVLWEEKEMIVKELGKRLFLDSGTLTPVLKKLEAKGYITRKRAKNDERNLVISITKNGELLKEQASEIPQKVGATICLSEEDKHALYQILHKILADFGGND